MNNNQIKNNGLKVVFKQDADALIPHTPMHETYANRASFSDVLDHFIKGFQRITIEIKHLFERKTFGIFNKISGITLGKLSILLIIILFILQKEVAFDYKTANFALGNTNEESTKPKTEKTTTKDTKRNFTAPASMGGIVTDLSPAALQDLRETQVRTYIEHFTKTAIGEMDKFGIPASISMAQAIVESRSGTSILAVKNNNHFGVKCFSKSCPKGHCSNFTDDHHKDFFRKYSGAWQSWREHSEFLMKNSYRGLLKHGKNYRSWAIGLKEIGYATDPSYDKKLISVIEKYDLHKLDDL